MAIAASRWRKRTSTSSGSTGQPFICTTLKNCVSCKSSRKSASVPLRRPRMRSLTFGGPRTAAVVMWLPPIVTACAGLRGIKVNCAGRLFKAVSTMSRPTRTSAALSSTNAPADRSKLRASATWQRTPVSSRMRNAARCRLSTSSSDMIGVGANGLTALRHGICTMSVGLRRRGDEARWFTL